MKKMALRSGVDEEARTRVFGSTVQFIASWLPVACQEEGINLADQRVRFRIIDVFECCDDDATHVLLEDAHFKRLKELFQKHKFPLAHRELIEFEDDLNAAEDVTVEEKK